MIILKPKTAEQARRLTRWGTMALSIITIAISAVMAFCLPSFGRMFTDLGIEFTDWRHIVLFHSTPIMWLCAGASIVAIGILKDRCLPAAAAQAVNAFLFFGLLALTSWATTATFLELRKVLEHVK